MRISLTSRHVRRLAAYGMMGALTVTLGGCSLSGLVDTKGEPGTIDPAGMQTEDAALLLYNGAILPFRSAFGGNRPSSYVLLAGHLSDELTTGMYPNPQVPSIAIGNFFEEIDYRNMPEDKNLRSNIEPTYRYLNLARNQAVDAIVALQKYAPFQPKDLIGHMYAIRGMSLIMLADLFCSGVPLTEYRSPGGFTYRPGSTTDSVYKEAIIQFDSALASIPDSATYKYFAQVGKARALLNLGKFAEAKAAVQGVPTNFDYKALYTTTGTAPSWVGFIFTYMSTDQYFGTVANRKGINGLPFGTANDPRVPVVSAPMQNSQYPATNYLLPKNFMPTGSTYNGNSPYPLGSGPITVSNGIEARLTEAEVAAQADDPSFLTILNTLRTTCATSVGCATPAPAGTGNVAGLPPLVDPGTHNARIKMVYDERGYWLYLTGHRQGDLRRLVRVYGWPQATVYPTGYFPAGNEQSYGTFTNIPVPYTEQAANPQYKGCINREA